MINDEAIFIRRLNKKAPVRMMAIHESVYQMMISGKTHVWECNEPMSFNEYVKFFIDEYVGEYAGMDEDDINTYRAFKAALSTVYDEHPQEVSKILNELADKRYECMRSTDSKWVLWQSYHEFDECCELFAEAFVSGKWIFSFFDAHNQLIMPSLSHGQYYNYKNDAAYYRKLADVIETLVEDE